MKRCTLLAVWAIVPLAVAAEDKVAEAKPSAKEILKQVDAAARAVKVARYEAAAEGLGDAKNTIGKVRGLYVLEGWDNRQPRKYYADVHYTLPNEDGEKHLTFGCDGETYFLIDHDKKKVYADMDPAVIGNRANIMWAALVPEFVHPEPFTDEINGESELKGETEIGGETCYEIHVKYARDAGNAVWFVSKKDHLPRRRIDDRLLPNGQTVKISRTITKLEIDPEGAEKQFTLAVPEGYEKEADFAP
jgi:hypothetical protein